MCRNIRLLHHFEPPTTEAEMRDAALQFVRKVSGTRAPSVADREAFERAVEEIKESTHKLLHALHARGEPHTREHEREKARARFAARERRAK